MLCRRPATPSAIGLSAEFVMWRRSHYNSNVLLAKHLAARILGTPLEAGMAPGAPGSLPRWGAEIHWKSMSFDGRRTV